jgi:iron complex transport system ATP-binding protein
VLRDVSATFERAEMVAVLGPNGAGKSTMLSVMAGLRSEYRGSCAYRGQEVRQWARRAFARDVSFVPQSLRLEFPFTAGQVALMGRTPHGDGLFESPEDVAAVERAMLITDTTAFRDRDFRSLSGGERQRVVLAAALAQSPQVMLLDEPTTFLDLKHQLDIYSLLRDLARQGMLVIAATHDINLAATYADRVILLRAGRLVADAPPAEALTPDRIREVFEVAAQIRPGPGDRPWIVYGA